ncbi:MAG TPA: response regulator [Bryobacteraceae bacterium]|nr:response regulator [Bryobacteraceae bacterium]
MPEVFLIEDNPADVLLTRQALSKYPIPLKIRVAKDGEQALTTLTTPDCKPNLIILDLNMPKVDGHTVLERYKCRNVPVVIFSSGGNQAEVDRALALGAREYVKKPIGFRPFVEAVCGIVDRWLRN